MNILQLSLAACPLIVAIIILRALLMHRLPKKTFPVLWALALARLSLPFSIPSPLSLGNIVAAGNANLPPALPQTLPLFAAEASPAATPGLMPVTDIPSVVSAAPQIPLLPMLWLVGCAACVLFFLITHLQARRVYQAAVPAENPQVQAWQAAHPTRRAARVRQSDELDSPLTFGILRPVILLPQNLDWQDETRLDYILTHEYVHIRRLDILAKWLLTAVLCAHWFNPLVWAMYVLANRDLELSCDEQVLRILGAGKKSAYALTLLSMEERRSGLTPLCNNFSKNAIEERIISIMKLKKVTKISIMAAFALVACLAMVFATSAMPAAAAAPTGYVERMLFASQDDTALKVTYDGETWETYNSAFEEQDWKWFSYNEYEKFAARALTMMEANHMAADYQEQARIRFAQTLLDIQNGIKVAKVKLVYLAEIGSADQPLEVIGVVNWRCFGYGFTDRQGNEVDLGLFETRDQLFLAVKQYFDAEAKAGRLTREEANGYYNRLAHSIREADEVPLREKLASNKKYLKDIMLN